MPSLAMTGFAFVLAALAALSFLLARRVERAHPRHGETALIDGTAMHYLDVPAGEQADLAPMVFIHGAAGNARDLHGAFAEALEGRGRMIFVDRPGAGYSGGRRHDTAPGAQANAIAGLIDLLGTGPAILVGHSLGSSVAAALAVHHPDKVAGLVLVAPATHPWPGNALTWYYNLARLPVLGQLFARLIAVPFGHLLYRRAVRSVFSPDPAPHDYEQRSGTKLVLRPANFHRNAADVGALKAHLAQLSTRYREIGAPTVIVTGDRDRVVAPHIHAEGLARDIAGARLVWLKGRGHMPTYSATAEIVAEIEKLNRRLATAGDRRESQMPERPSLAT